MREHSVLIRQNIWANIGTDATKRTAKRDLQSAYLDDYRFKSPKLFPATHITAFEIMGVDISDKTGIFSQKNHGRALLEIDPLPAGTFCRHWRPAVDPDCFRPRTGCAAG